jgi:tRNA dimethylallyltransferase
MKKNVYSGKIFLIIAGPTGTGKSSVALELAKIIPSEIINADSRQFYKEINIGAAKPPETAFQQVVHHLYGFISLKENFTVFDFRKELEKLVPEIWNRKKAVIVVGGSGLYIRAVMKGIFDFPAEKKAIQNEIRKKLLNYETGKLYQELKQVDCECASKIHPNDRRRIVRALEVYHLTGLPMSTWQKQAKPASFIQDAIVKYWILNMQREKLYSRLDLRVEAMLESGWLDEVKNLVDAGLKQYLEEKAPIGYIELCDYIEGKISYDYAVEIIKRKTRNYARRQLTWFRKEKDAEWIDVTTTHPEDVAMMLAEEIKKHTFPFLSCREGKIEKQG